MVKGLIAIALIGLVVVVAGIFLFNRASANKVSNTPDLTDVLNQVDLPVNAVQSTVGLLGFDPKKVNRDASIDEIKENILSNNLATEESIRKLNDELLNKTQINTITPAGTQTKEIQGIVLAESPTSFLRVEQAFAPAGEGEFLTVRGTPLAQNAIARTEETFSGTLKTATGGEREIRGSKALFDRLQANLQKSTI